jgi:large subunit ribosomal protein L5
MAASKSATKPYQARLQQLYKTQFEAELKNELQLNNVNQVPKLEKIVINSGVGKAKDDNKLMDTMINTLRKISGQQPVQTVAKKSIASFKLREGDKVGLKVTLRGERMYEFMDRLINIVLPRLRDFHGVSERAFDKQGNYALGLTDQSVFPELSFEETSPAHGIQVIFVIKAEQPAHSRALLAKMGLPFTKESK